MDPTNLSLKREYMEGSILEWLFTEAKPYVIGNTTFIVHPVEPTLSEDSLESIALAYTESNAPFASVLITDHKPVKKELFISTPSAYDQEKYFLQKSLIIRILETEYGEYNKSAGPLKLYMPAPVTQVTKDEATALGFRPSDKPKYWMKERMYGGVRKSRARTKHAKSKVSHARRRTRAHRRRQLGTRRRH